MRLLTIFLSGMFGFCASCCSQSNLHLLYKAPAKEWEECVPIGNGRLGAMPDGGVVDENIVLNDITLWSGGPQDADKEGAFRYLPEIRKLLFQGKNVEAEKLVKKEFLCKGPATGSGKGADLPYGCYQVLGNLHINYNYGITNAVIPINYTRSLSLDSAVARCSYQINGVTYKREYFTSFSGDVIMIRLSADQPGKISFALSLDRPERYESSVKNNELSMSGQLNNGTDGKGMRYLTRVRIKASGGNSIAGDSTLEIHKANSVVIYVSSCTDYLLSAYAEKSKDLMNKAISRSYKKELAEHVRIYQSLFRRASLWLGPQNLEKEKLPTDQRLAEFEKNPDNGLTVLYFQFGRYLLISSTRPGLLPPNLQGLWANTIQTPWNGDYHLDINIEMNHWPLDLTNLPMLNEPFFDLVKGMVKPGEKTAMSYYNSKGWIAYSSTNIWGYTSPGLGVGWGNTIASSGWLCHVLWDHYAYSKDLEYLRKIYPLLKGAAEFYIGSLVKEPVNGWLVMAPSNSPENPFKLPDGRKASVCAGSTIDNQVIRELFRNLILATRLLNTDTSFRNLLEVTRNQLPPNQIDKNGRLMEWLEPYEEIYPNHRHLSPLWGLFPGNEITSEKSPDLLEASKALLVRRGDESTGWSLAWKINLWARLKNGNRAYRLLCNLMRLTKQKDHGTIGGVYPNLFDACPPFQIDGNFGGTAGIAEMLLQSSSGYIEILPALPDQWKDGNFKGLCVRGGGIVSAKWENRHLLTASLKAIADNSFQFKVPPTSKCNIFIDQHPVKALARNGMLGLTMKKGQTAYLYFE